MYNVFIYCNSKSEGSTLNNIFTNNGFNSIDTKSLTNEKYDIFKIIENSSNHYDEIYIIDSYRTPIECKISNYFQNMLSDPVENIIKTFNKEYLYTKELYSINEILDYYKLPYFDNFDFEKKYNIIKHKNITFIKLLFNDISNWGVILSEIFQKQITIYKENLTENKDVYKLFKEQYKLPREFIYTNLIYDKEFGIYNTLEQQEQYIIYWLSNSIQSSKINKTLFGKNKTLYLKSEVQQHYVDTYSDEIININNSIVIDYYNNLQSFCQNSHIFIVPDKSVINQQDLPEDIDSTKLFRFADNINHPNIHDLYKYVELNNLHYYKTDSHMNHQGTLLIFYKIMEKLGFEKSDIKYIINNNNNYKGDLTSYNNIGLEEDKTSFIKEDVIFHNVINDSKNVITKINPYNRICFFRPSKYFINKNYIINKKILIFGDSTTSDQRLFDYFTSIFKETLFYWNHLYINNELIKEYKPDIILDIRTERFLNLYNNKIQFKICNPMKNITLTRTTNQIMDRLILSKNLNEIINIYTLDEINYINNNILFSNFLYYNSSNIKNIKNIPEDFNWKDYVEINEVLKNMNELQAKNHYEYYGYKENRKYKYENIPEDFNWNIYIEINEDLKHMNELQAKNHYEYTGYKENRKYKYENIPEDFNWKIYIEINEDLKHMNELQAKIHYEYTGYKENRKYKIDISLYPRDFSPTNYKIINTDLKHLTDLQAYLHYIHQGIQEHRSYKINNKLYYSNSFNINKDLFIDNVKYDMKLPTNYTLYNNNSVYDYLHSDKLVLTKIFNKEHTTTKINNSILDKINTFILIVDLNNGGGGTTIFLNKIVSKYKYHQTFIIARCFKNILTLNINDEYTLEKTYTVKESLLFLEQYQSNISKIFVNHTLNHSLLFINKLFTLGIDVITITHDHYSIINVPQQLFYDIDTSTKQLIEINNYTSIITQNIENLHIFGKYYNKNISVIELPDYKFSDKMIKYTNSKKVIGIIGSITDIKGQQLLKQIIKYYKNSKYVEIVVIGCMPEYNKCYCYTTIEEFNDILIKVKPNILLELSLWPETYSYTLSLAMITNLPILCLKKNYPSVIVNRLQKYNKSYFFNNIIQLNNLIHIHSQNFLNTIKPIIYYDKFWNDLFINKTNKIVINKNINFKNDIKPYFIYFPQFHTIPENDKFYYPGFNDIKNLKLYNDSNDIKLDEPSIDYFEISDIEKYNLTDKNIIQKQIDLIYDYEFEGLAIYYYWFSKNTITHKNQIMKGVFDIIFDEKMINMKNRKIFFIWANENWTNSTINNTQIINDYTEESLYKMSNDLIQYFQNPIYLKIDNKPVLFIYHNFFMNSEQLHMFSDILKQICINLGFNGVHIVINSFWETNQPGFKEFYINFNYKKEESRYWDSKNNQIYLDYTMYIHNDYHSKDVIQTIVYDFNNKPRLFKPNNLKSSTECLNNTEFHKILFTEKLIKKYENKKEDIDKLLLVNALNEWGENMTFEPSNKYGFYNINLLTNLLCKKNN
jgi:hypothetical protein